MTLFINAHASEFFLFFIMVVIILSGVVTYAYLNVLKNRSMKTAVATEKILASDFERTDK